MQLLHGDCLELMRALPDRSVDLIATDPPYYKVKGDAWDRQWDTPAAFLAWFDLLAEQWQRILRPNGSLYTFAWPGIAAEIEVLIKRRFNVLQRITWAKPPFSTKAEMNKKADQRSFFPVSEAIIFAEHKGADNMAKGEAGYAAKCEDLRCEYEDLRRPFSVTADVPYTDVWTYPTVGRRVGKHPCEKPLAMMEDIIRASSRPGAIVFDPFMGSGVTGEAAVRLGREFIGMEAGAEYFAGACTRVRAAGPAANGPTVEIAPALAA